MIVPGSVNPLLLCGGGDPLDEFGTITRSLRFRKSAGAYLMRVFGVPTNALKWSASRWVKVSDLAAYIPLLCAQNSNASGVRRTVLMFGLGSTGISDTAIQISSYFSSVYTGQHRDIAGHCHVVYNYDSAQAVASDRFKVWVNNKLLPLSGTMPSINFACAINMNGMNTYENFYSDYVSGNVISDFIESQDVFVDGQALPPSAFGRQHPATGQWRPILNSSIRGNVAAGGGARNGFGANGHLLPFGLSDFSGTTVYDRSQSDTDTTGNNWTSTNISLSAGATYDLLTDTPTNVFATISPLCFNTASTVPVISNANLRFTGPSGIASVGYGSMVIPKTGVWQWEIKPTGGATVGYIGVAKTPVNVTAATDLGQSVNEYAYRLSTGNKHNNGASTAYAAGVSASDVVGVVFDADARTVSIFKNGNPFGVMFGSLPVGDYLPGFDTAGGEYFDVNFGARGFDYPIAGAKALNTKNLKYPVVSRSESVFVARIDTGANIVATMAAAASWPDWIRIYKRREAAEGWRWQFSDDSANYLDSSSTAAKAAFPALAGTSYVGYDLKVAALNGVATGRLTHVNGVADVVTDGLSNSRKIIFLKNEAAGSWFVYHPDLTPGELLYLERTSIEDLDASINTVTATGFTAAAALASGMYRWIAFAEIDGFFKLFRYMGNGGNDGPMINLGLQPKLVMIKGASIGGSAGFDFTVWDTNCNPNNVVPAGGLGLNTNTAENGTVLTTPMDIVSNGIKIRNGAQPTYNQSGQNYIGFAFAAFPFRYANAR